MPGEGAGWVLWGAELSPFALKIEAMLRFAALPFQWQPRAGGSLRALGFALRRSRVVARRLPLTWPPADALDEFPLVPFLFGPDGENLYDSSAIGAWLDGRRPHPDAGPLLPDDDPAMRWVVRLIDEALDEVGLYLAHHNRWVVSARDNGAGARLAAEMRPIYGPAAPILARAFPARQVRRLPYLLSVADPADESFADLPPALRPPARAGFPATHALLDEAYRELLAAVEAIVERQPFLFGRRFSLADASVYGQIGMNRGDATACDRLARLAPSTRAWIERIAAGRFDGHDPRAPWRMPEQSRALLAWTFRFFVPLMRQNLAAYERHRAAGETTFNEEAFDRGRALYDGSLAGRPLRAVAKTFQVRVWRDLVREAQALDAPGRRRLEAWLPAPGLEALPA